MDQSVAGKQERYPFGFARFHVELCPPGVVSLI
jgi:hypothetical protein